MKPGSKKWKNFMSKLYGIGAAIVIIGAMFKIMHWPGAGPMLVIGLSTEAVIFFFSAFEPPHAEYDWSLVYPELALGNSEDDLELDALATGKTGTVTEELDKMFEEAKIEPELIRSLGDGLRNLNSTADQIGNVANASVASEEYVNSLKNASGKVGALSDAYAKASESLMGLTSTEEEGQSFGEQMQKVTTNLSSLNNVYEMQLKHVTENLDSHAQIQSGISELMTNLTDSVDDTKAYKENIAELSKNLSKLNNVYGNMLNAMSSNNG